MNVAGLVVQTSNETRNEINNMALQKAHLPIIKAAVRYCSKESSKEAQKYLKGKNNTSREPSEEADASLSLEDYKIPKSRRGHLWLLMHNEKIYSIPFVNSIINSALFPPPPENVPVFHQAARYA